MHVVKRTDHIRTKVIHRDDCPRDFGGHKRHRTNCDLVRMWDLAKGERLTGNGKSLLGKSGGYAVLAFPSYWKALPLAPSLTSTQRISRVQ